MTASPHSARRRWTIGGGLTLGAVAVGVALLALAAGDGSPSWRRAVAFSGVVCGSAALTGWGAARWPHSTPAMTVAGGLAAVVLRIMPPLAALGWLTTAGGDLRAAGADRLLVVFYLALLASDIALHIMERGRGGSPGGGNAAN